MQKPIPPKSNATKATSRYSAFIKQTRICAECGVRKPISNKTYALKNKGPDGLSSVCRQCQGSSARKRLKHPKAPKGFQADPRYNWEAFCEEIDKKVALLTELTNSKVKRLEDIEQLKADLTSVTRLKGDPSPGGFMTDERLTFRVFIRMLKNCLGNYCELGPIHEDILDALLCHEPNVCLLASRNSAKSTLTSQYVAWRLWRNPEEIVLTVSRGEALARRMLKATRGYLEMSPLLQEMLPEEDQLDSAHQLEVAQARGKLGMSVSLTCRGIGGNLPGLRATLIIADDVEGPKDDTPEAVDRLEEVIDEFSNIGSPGCEVKMLGTPQSEFSLYGRLSRSKAWDVFTARMFDSDTLDGREVFHSRWPDRWPVEEIEKKKRTLTKRAFNLHWRIDLSKTSDDAHPLCLSDLPVLNVPSDSQKYPVEIHPGGDVLRGLPRGSAENDDEWRSLSEVSQDWTGITQTIASVDPASGLTGRDAIGVSIVSVIESGYAVIRHCSGVRAPTTQSAMQTVAGIISRHRANTLLVEETQNGLFGQTLCQLLAARGYPLRFDKVTGGGIKKGRRILEAISPALASGRVVICKDVLTAEDAAEFVNQYTGIREDSRKLRHDDLIDSLSYALAAVGPVLSTDQASLIASSRVSFEALRKMPWRATLMSEEEMEAYGDIDENMQTLRLKCAHVAKTIQEDALQGKHDLGLQAHLEKLEDELSRIDTGKVTVLKSTLRRYAQKEGSYRKGNDIDEQHISLSA